MFRCRPVVQCLFVAGLWTGSVLVPPIDAMPRRGEAAEPAPRDPFSELILQLGDRSFEVREQAGRRLRESGLEALPALSAAVEHPDLEIRFRAARLLEEIERLDHERRLNELLQTEGDAPDDLLPGWGFFRNLVGDDPQTRELFADMQRREARLFRLLPQGGSALKSAYGNRCIELQFQYSQGGQRETAFASTCALLLIGSHPNSAVTEQTVGILYGFLQFHEVRKPMTDGEQSEPARRLLGRWIAQPVDAGAFQRIMLSLRYDIDDGLVPALQVLRDGGANASQHQYALFAVGKLGDRQEHLPVVEKLLEDESLLSSNAVRKLNSDEKQAGYTCQLRDVALAVAVHLTDQDPENYGFSRLKEHPQYLFAPNSAGFNSDSERENAFRRWKRWKSDQPDRQVTSKSTPSAE